MLSLMERVFFLEKVPLLRQLDLQDLAQVAAVAEEVTLPPAAVLFRQGDPGDALWVVLDGEVAILLAGREVNVMRRGQSFGEIAVLDDAPRTAEARSRDDVYALKIGRRTFAALLQRNGALRLAVVRELAARHEAIAARVQVLEARQGAVPGVPA